MSEINFNTDCSIQNVDLYAIGSPAPLQSSAPQPSTQSTISSLKSESVTFGSLFWMVRDACHAIWDYFFETPKLAFESWSLCPENSDGRAWKLDFTAQTKNGNILEYTLPGESVENWSELVTVQLLLDIPSSPKVFTFLMMSDIQKSCNSSLGEKMKFKLFSETPDSIGCEWFLSGGADPNFECFKVIKTEHALYRFAYTTRTLDKAKQWFPIWKKILEETSVSLQKEVPSDAEPLKLN